MKRYAIAAAVCVVLIIGTMQYHRKATPKHYKNWWPKSVLVKDTTVWLYDSLCYRQSGIYKRVYKRYNYEYYDSTFKYERPREFLEIEYAVTCRGDVVFEEYTDLTNYPRRGD